MSSVVPADERIRATAEDATATKFSAVQAGYYQDPFVGSFHSASSRTMVHHRRRPVPVIIKRGTFARVAVVSKVVRTFLDLVRKNGGEKGGVAQVVLLGAGKDTMYFRLGHSLLGDTTNHPFVRWVEVDHLPVLQEKVSVIEHSHSLFGLSVHGSLATQQMCELRAIRTQSVQSTCHLVAHDLSQDPQALCQTLTIRAGLDSGAPTLFISECVLMYLPDDAARSLVTCLSRIFLQACFCLYEPIIGNDAFGQMMEKNLTKAGVAQSDSCLVQTRALASYMAKMSQTGFVRSIGCDMNEAYATILSPEERGRASQCEFLDELEEFVLIMQHYCFVVACTEQSRIGRQLCQSGSESPLGFSLGKCQEF
jgi:tRNA wybutosine-synthesizing protein 4